MPRAGIMAMHATSGARRILNMENTLEQSESHDVAGVKLTWQGSKLYGRKTFLTSGDHLQQLHLYIRQKRSRD